MAKIITFYLPQFHAIPENDAWWGEGFTEWTNVRKGTPLWEGHYQPKVPLDEDYYCLLDPEVMKKQAKLARQYGVYGFAYYHYWFGNGRKLLEKPVEMMLENPEIDMPFVLSWANENWSRNWDGGNRELLLEQDYGDESYREAHLQYLLPFFRDPRYIRMDGKPVFLIYRPELIDDFDEMISFFRRRMVEEGFPGIVIMSQYAEVFRKGRSDVDVDYMIKFEPAYANGHFEHQSRVGAKIAEIMYGGKLINGFRVRDYDKTWNYILHKERKGGKLVPGAFVDWDNSARNKKGNGFRGATPEKFGRYLSELLAQVKSGEYKTDYVFVNAWNEWGEGAYLEPDEKHRYGYLEALKKALSENSESN